MFLLPEIVERKSIELEGSFDGVFTTEQKVVFIKKPCLVLNFVSSFSVKGFNICVSNTFFGITVFLTSDNEVTDKIRLFSWNKITGKSCQFDNKNKILYIAFDNKILKISVKQTNNRAKICLEKTLRISLRDKERAEWLLLESGKEFKGFWVKTNLNGFYFIETKEHTGNDSQNKLWRIRTYTKRTNFELNTKETINAITSHDNSLFVVTTDALYKLQIENTKLIIESSISFSSAIANSKMFIKNNHVVIAGSSSFGTIIVGFNLNNFAENTMFWSFSEQDDVLLHDATVLNSSILLVPKEMNGIFEITKLASISDRNQFLRDNKKSPSILDSKETVLSNFTENETIFFFVSKVESSLIIKAFNKQTFEQVLHIKLGKHFYNKIIISFHYGNLYLITDKGILVVYGFKI